MKTQQEILSRIKEDFFGFQRAILLSYLDFENVKPLLKDGVAAEEWIKQSKSPKESMLDYLGFAWRKASNKRGLSASRSMDIYTSWLWLDGSVNILG